MRKLILCAAAAIVALASCSKTEVINSEVPQEIGFKAVTGAMTKAETTNTNLQNEEMGVFAYVNETGALYFSNEAFKLKTGQTDWSGVTPQYWPVAHNLDFVVYHPHQTVADSKPAFDYEYKQLTVNATNGSVDYLYGEIYYNNERTEATGTITANGYDKNTTSVGVVLNHAKAKVTVKMTCSNVTISNLKLDSQIMSGIYYVVYDFSPTTGQPSEGENIVTWSFDTVVPEEVPITLTNNEGYVLVVPSTKSAISFDYQIAGSSAVLHYEIPGNITWEHGKNYIFNITVTPKEIKFTPSVENWGTTTDTPVVL